MQSAADIDVILHSLIRKAESRPLPQTDKCNYYLINSSPFRNGFMILHADLANVSRDLACTFDYKFTRCRSSNRHSRWQPKQVATRCRICPCNPLRY